MSTRPRSRRKKSDLCECQDCKVQLNDENWTASNQKYGRYICAPCFSARQRKYHEAAKARDPEWEAKRRAVKVSRRAERTPEKKEADRRRDYNRWLVKNYGITIEQYDSMFEEQSGKCAICQTEKPRGKGGFHVDHDHATGKVRKLLCTSCNMALGLLNDNEELLVKASEYLKEHR
jgi:hypothetical protein